MRIHIDSAAPVVVQQHAAAHTHFSLRHVGLCVVGITILLMVGTNRLQSSQQEDTY